MSQFPSDDILLVSKYQWPRRGDHRIVLAEFLVAEAQRLLKRAETLVSTVETAASDGVELRDHAGDIGQRPGAH